MGLGLEVIDTFVTNPGVGAVVATAAYPGDVLAVRSADPTTNIWMLDVWGAGAALSINRIRSPRLHDNVNGLRFRRAAAAPPRGFFTDWEKQRLYSQDAMIVEQNGGAAETDGTSYLAFYENLGGINANLATWDAVMPRIVNLYEQEIAIGGGAGVGTRIAGVAINFTFDTMKANTWYALLGYEVDAVGQSVGIRGPDTGNLRVGGPMTTEAIETRDWFQRLSIDHGIPMIPLIQSANKGGTLIDTTQVVAGVAANVTLIMAELTP